jgi:hypothetical protein
MPNKTKALIEGVLYWKAKADLHESQVLTVSEAQALLMDLVDRWESVPEINTSPSTLKKLLALSGPDKERLAKIVNPVIASEEAWRNKQR